MGDTLKIGIIGLEDRGLERAEIFTKLNQSVVGTDIDPDRRKRFEKIFDANTFRTPEELLSSEIDAVAVITPNKYHEELVNAAFNHGYDVFIDKPLAHSLNSAERIAAIADETDRFGMVGYSIRFLDSCRILKRCIEEGLLGEIVYVEGRYIRRRGTPGIANWFTNRELAGGGALLDLGSHVVDFANYVVGEQSYSEKMAVTRREIDDEDTPLNTWGDDQKRGFTVEDSASGLLRSDSGHTLSIEVAWASNSRRQNEYYIRGTEGGIFLDISDAPRLSIEQDRKEILQLYGIDPTELTQFIDSDVKIKSSTTDGDADMTLAVRSEPMYIRRFKTFIQAVRDGSPPGIYIVDQALEIQRVIEELYDVSTYETPY